MTPDFFTELFRLSVVSMAKYYTTEHIHPYSWDQVAQAVFQRYPNPHAQHVLSEDTLHREIVNDDTLYSRRYLISDVFDTSKFCALIQRALRKGIKLY